MASSRGRIRGRAKPAVPASEGAAPLGRGPIVAHGEEVQARTRLWNALADLAETLRTAIEEER